MTSMKDLKDINLLAVSAHAGDYVWRSGGTLAKYAKHGSNVHVLVLSFGVRGESNDIWKQGGQTYDSVKEIREGETRKAAEILGVKNIEFWDMVDYPLQLTAEHDERLVRKIREVQADIIITHDAFDILNPDHNKIHEFVYRASIMSNSSGVVLSETQTTKQMRIFGFEPHQTELSHYVPDSFVDITDTFDQKRKAMECFQAQKHLIEYYSDRAAMRGNHARRLSGNQSYRYAESFSNFFPVVGDRLY